MRLRHRPWAAGVIDSNRDIALNRKDEGSLAPFDRLEIGSGRGLFLLEKAKMEPNHQFLGLEMNYNAFALAVKRAAEMNPKVPNARFLNDTYENVADLIPVNSVEELYLNFSDPWPKTKQQKRRLTYPDRLAEYYRILKVGGKLFFKTDNVGLYEASVSYFETFGKFKILFEGIYEKDEPTDVCTEFEHKFRSQGLPIYRIVALKDTDDSIVIDSRRRLGHVPEFSLWTHGKADRLTEATFQLKGRLDVKGPFPDGNMSLLSNSNDQLKVAGTDLVRTLVDDFHDDPSRVTISSLADGDTVMYGETILTVDGVAKDSDLGKIILHKTNLLVRLATLTSDLIGKVGKDNLGILTEGSQLARELEGYAFYVGGGRLICDKPGAALVLFHPVQHLSSPDFISLVDQTRILPPGSPRPRRTIFISSSTASRDVEDLISALGRTPKEFTIAGVVFPVADADFLLTAKDLFDRAGLFSIKLGLEGGEQELRTALAAHPSASSALLHASASEEGPVVVQ